MRTKYSNKYVKVKVNKNTNITNIEDKIIKKRYILISKKEIEKVVHKLTPSQDYKRFLALKEVKTVLLEDGIVLKENLLIETLDYFWKYNIIVRPSILIKVSQLCTDFKQLKKRYLLYIALKANDTLLARRLINSPEKAQALYNKKVEDATGENNVFYNHNGKFSSLSKNFNKYNDLTEKEKIAEIEKVSNKISKSHKENGNNSTTLLYWIKKGYTEEEARHRLAERQRTFSLEKCIEKYGEVEGYIRFNERQEKWQETLNNKSQEEKDRINKLKGSGLNAGWGLQKIRNYGIKESKDKKCLLYYIKFYNNDTEFWKIGITTKTIIERFGNETIFKNKTGLNMEIISIEESNFYDCFIKEQTILSDRQDKRIQVDYNNFSSSECFSENINLDINQTIYKDIESKI